MPSLRAVLDRHAADIMVLGGPKTKLDVAALRGDLEAVRKRNSATFWICVAMVVVAFGALVTTTFVRLGSPVIVQVVQGLFGITASGLIYWMFRMWRAKLLTETLMAVAVSGSEDALRQLLLIIRNVLLGDRDRVGG